MWSLNFLTLTISPVREMKHNLNLILKYKIRKFIFARSKIFWINVHTNSRCTSENFTFQILNLSNYEAWSFFRPKLIIKVKKSFSIITMKFSSSVNNCYWIIKLNLFAIFYFFNVPEPKITFQSFCLLDSKLKFFSLHLKICVWKCLLLRSEVVTDESHFREHHKINLGFWIIFF